MRSPFAPEFRHKAIDTGRVLRIVTGHALQQQRAILCRPGQGARVIQGEGERQDANPAGQTISRLDASDPTKRRRSTNGPACVGSGAA